jgi:hypothetical protein
LPTSAPRREKTIANAGSEPPAADVQGIATVDSVIWENIADGML